MSYGKLDVYWPDGPVETHILTKPITAVGRSSGNDIILDTTSVSRYHISLTHKDNQIILEDLESINGTYVDGEHLRAHEPRVLHGGEEIQIGDIRLIYHPEEQDIPTQPTTVPEDNTERIEVIKPTFKITLDPPRMAVTPGTHVQGVLIVENTGTEADHYFIEVDGVAKNWVRLERAEFDLVPGFEAEVMVSFKPLRRSDSAPGEYPVTVRVRAKSAPDQPAEAQMTLWVLSYSGFGIALVTPEIDAQTPFEIHVHNQGSAPLPLVFGGFSFNNDLLFDIRPPGLTLGPGERQIVRGYVRLRRAILLGRGHSTEFDIMAQSQDASYFLTAVSGQFAARPLLPVWLQGIFVLGLIAIPLLLIAMVAGFIALGPRPTPTPEPMTATILAGLPILKVNTFTIMPNPVLRYVQQDVVIDWNVAGASTVQFQGIEALTGRPDNTVYAGKGRLTLNGTPRDALALYLLAYGSHGTSITQQIQVQIANPACQVVGDGTPIYAGPGDIYTQIKSLKSGDMVNPDGHDRTGLWMHLLPAPDPQAWVKISAVNCQGFTPEQLTLIADIPPLPTLTSLPQAISTVVISTPPSQTATIEATTIEATPTLTPIIMPTLSTPTPTGQFEVMAK